VKRHVPFVTAALVLVGALIHIKLYFDGYRSVPKANLGRSFLLNGAAGIVLAIAFVSIGSASRLGRLTRAATAGWAAPSLVALAMSRTWGCSDSPSPVGTRHRRQRSPSAPVRR
jgi:hypothetical protein